MPKVKREPAAKKGEKPWLDDGWLESDIEEFKAIIAETEEINRRQAALTKRAKDFNRKIQLQREAGFTAA